MPNFKLSPNMRTDIRRAAGRLTTTYVECMRQGFPLTAEEVQAAILEPELLATMRMLDMANVATFTRENAINVRMNRADLTGVTRGVLLHINTPELQLFAKKFPYHYDGHSFDNDIRNFQALSLDFLPLEKQTQLAKWINEVVKAMRLQEMAIQTVSRALDYLDSTGRVLANWPMLGTLSKDKDLIKKFRLAPVRLAPYVMPQGADHSAHWVRDTRQVTATNVVLNTALLMETSKDDTKPSATASVLRWEKLDADPVF